MFIAFLPLLGAAARVLGTRTAASLAAGGLSQFLGSGRSGGGVDVAALGRRLGTPNPSQEQIAAAQRAQLASSAAGAVKSLAAVGAMGPAVIATTSALERFGGLVLSQRQQLAQYDARVSTAFAQLARQDVMLGVRTAGATGGSTQGLADAVMALRGDIQPIGESLTTFMNVGGYAMTQLGRGLVKLLDLMQIVDIMQGVAKFLEDKFGGDAESGIQTQLKKQLEHLAAMHAIERTRLEREITERPKNKPPASDIRGDGRPDVFPRPW